MNDAMPSNAAFTPPLTRTSAVGRRWNNEPVSHEAFQKRRALISYHASSWNQALASRFDHLTALPAGWDGYAGRPVSFSCAVFAANILEHLCNPKLPPPYLVPGSDGTIQIEWHIHRVDIEIDVLGPNEVVASRFVADTGADERFNLSKDFSPLVRWIDDLRSRCAGS